MKQYYYITEIKTLNFFSFFFIINNNNIIFSVVSVVIVVVGKLLLNKIKNRFFYDPQHRDRILHSYEAYFRYQKREHK